MVSLPLLRPPAGGRAPRGAPRAHRRPRPAGERRARRRAGRPRAGGRHRAVRAVGRSRRTAAPWSPLRGQHPHRPVRRRRPPWRRGRSARPPPRGRERGRVRHPPARHGGPDGPRRAGRHREGAGAGAAAPEGRRDRAARTTSALLAAAEFRILCAHRRGPFGAADWNRLAERWMCGADGAGAAWFAGRPLLATRNDSAARSGQRRHGCGGPPRRSARGRVPHCARGADVRDSAARGRGDRLRDDHPQEPGVGVPHRGAGAAAGELAVGRARAASTPGPRGRSARCTWSAASRRWSSPSPHQRTA